MRAASVCVQCMPMEDVGPGPDRSHLELEQLPKAEVQIFDYYQKDLAGWTTERWSAHWTAYDSLPKAARCTAHAASLVAAPMYEPRPPWIVQMFQQTRFVRNSGRTQVVLPTQMVVWGEDKEICSTGPYTRLRADIFARVLKDITATESAAHVAHTIADVCAALQPAGASGADHPSSRARGCANSKRVTSRSQRKRRMESASEESESSDPTASEEGEEQEEEDEEQEDTKDEHVVEKIIRRTKEHGVDYYLIKWLGAEVDESSSSHCWKKCSELKKTCSRLVAAFEKAASSAAASGDVVQRAKRACRR
jgi:hypothetical protein